MNGNLLRKITRFRAYQLGSAGSSFSYFDGMSFTLIEARLSDLNRPRIIKEMEICGVHRLNCLHITSWDTDHCGRGDLAAILETFRPLKIECPGYPPGTDTARECLKLIIAYQAVEQVMGRTMTVQSIDPPYIRSLSSANALGYRDIIYHPKSLFEKSNDNSTIKLFRTGSFNVASLGDVENNFLSASLCDCSIFTSEVDVMILAHHGADNGFTTNRFLRAVKPTLAVCSSDYDNQFDHPRDEIREMLQKYNIPIFTTKTGDVAIQSTMPHTSAFRVINLKADSTEISSEKFFTSKKSSKLSHNIDTIQNNYGYRRSPVYSGR